MQGEKVIESTLKNEKRFPATVGPADINVLIVAHLKSNRSSLNGHNRNDSFASLCLRQYRNSKQQEC